MNQLPEQWKICLKHQVSLALIFYHTIFITPIYSVLQGKLNMKTYFLFPSDYHLCQVLHNSYLLGLNHSSK
jgi:hypothetical protein